MTATIIDGKKAAEEIRESVKNEVLQRKENGLSAPGLATVLAGDDPASQSYVKAKHRACEELGITSFGINLPKDISQEKLENVICELAADKMFMEY